MDESFSDDLFQQCHWWLLEQTRFGYVAFIWIGQVCVWTQSHGHRNSNAHTQTYFRHRHTWAHQHVHIHLNMHKCTSSNTETQTYSLYFFTWWKHLQIHLSSQPHIFTVLHANTKTDTELFTLKHIHLCKAYAHVHSFTAPNRIM